LRLLSQDESWQAFESAITRNLLRVYALEASTVRIDTTSASGYWGVTAGGLFQLGHSKDHRPDLPQLKVALSTLDPLGLPVATDVLEGNRADDPVYIPSVERVRKTLKKKGLLYVGDAKMAALDTRAFIAAGLDHYLCPLAKSQCSDAQLSAYLAALETTSPTRISDQEQRPVAEVFEQVESVTAEIGGEVLTWKERRLVVRSLAQAEAAEKYLQERLAKAEHDLARLNERGRGRARHDDRAAFEAQVEALLKRHRVEGLFRIEIETESDHRTVRAYGDLPMRIQWRHRYSVVFAREEGALAASRQQLGWRVYATNHPGLTMDQAVWAYRNQYVLERSFGRLKGRPLSLTPMYLQRDDHATGLVRLLSLGLRVLILLEFVVRRQLASEQATLAGLYAGNPKRATARPTAELLLEAFDHVTLTVVVLAGGRYYHISPLTGLQERILCLLGFAAEVYTRLCSESVKPP
jgi:transposase